MYILKDLLKYNAYMFVNLKKNKKQKNQPFVQIVIKQNRTWTNTTSQNNSRTLFRSTENTIEVWGMKGN